MPLAQLAVGSNDRQLEKDRLAALHSTEILDTPAEAGFDAISRLAAEYFGADMAGIGLADESRVWIKSCWGQKVKELPRKNSVFELVLEADGTVIIPDASLDPSCVGLGSRLRHLGMVAFAGAPVRCFEGKILGVLAIFHRRPTDGLTPDQVRMLESLADMVSSQLELRTLRRSFNRNGSRRARAAVVDSSIWPRRPDLRHALEHNQFVLHYQPEIDLSTRKIIGLLLNFNVPLIKDGITRIANRATD